ncbi:MAG: hypothetical protein KF729_30280 [Sandaracinaceae bacterium]|nr:hypothetical protein [Sandaracinaceae bacterium]
MRRPGLALLAVLALGCEPRELTWSYRLDPALRGVAESLELGFVRDGCTGERDLTITVPTLGGAPSAELPTLAPGVWGFEVTAHTRASGRTPIGRGCEAVELPTSEPFVVVVAPLGATPDAGVGPGDAAP